MISFIFIIILGGVISYVSADNMCIQCKSTRVSLAFYYDYFAGRDIYTNSLAIPAGVETVFGGNDGNGPPLDLL